MPANGKNKNQPRATEWAATPPSSGDPSRYALTGWQGGSVELGLPSGQLCLVRRIGVQKLIEEGVIDNFDTLTGLVQTKHVSKKAKNSGPQRKREEMEADIAVKKLMRSPEKLREITEIMDKVVMASVIAPELHPLPEEGEERIPGAAYIDWVMDEDKAYIVNFVFGGTRDLERFRGELAELGDGVDDVADVESPAE